MDSTATTNDAGAKEQAQEKAQEVAGQAQEKAQQAASDAKSRVSEQVDQRSTEAGRAGRRPRRATSAGVGEELRKQGKDQPAKIAEQVADRAERVGGYLERSDGDAILRDVEDFGRRQPWAVVLGGLAIGVVASRLLKASSEGRYAQSRRTAQAGMNQLRPQPQSQPEQVGTPEPVGTPQMAGM